MCISYHKLLWKFNDYFSSFKIYEGYTKVNSMKRYVKICDFDLGSTTISCHVAKSECIISLLFIGRIIKCIVMVPIVLVSH
jgi:hypothetical protein